MIVDEARVVRLDKKTDAVIVITHSSHNTLSNTVLDSLCDDLYIILILIEQVNGEISFLCHIQEISGGIGSNFRAKVYSKGYRVFSIDRNVNYPSKSNLWEVKSEEDVLNLPTAIETEARVFNFRQMIPIPPFLVKAISNSRVTESTMVAFIVAASG